MGYLIDVGSLSLNWCAMKNCSLFFFLLFHISLLFSTCTHLTIYKSPEGLPIFFLEEEHGLENPHPGGNKVMIDTFLKILEDAEKIPGGGYRVLVEGTFPAIKERVVCSYDLLDVLVHAGTFKQSTLIDIEVRHMLIGIGTLIASISPWSVGKIYKDLSPEESAEKRKQFKECYKCDIDKVTFNDMFTEIDKQIKKIETLKNEWSTGFTGWTPTGLVASQRIGFYLHCLCSEYEQLKDAVKEYTPGSNEIIMDWVLRVWFLSMGGTYRDRPKGKYKPEDRFKLDGDLKSFQGIIDKNEKGRKLIRKQLLRVGKWIFDIFLIDRIIRMVLEDSTKPIVVIAGGDHASRVRCFLENFGYSRVDRYYKFDEKPPGDISIPLKIDDLKHLKRPLSEFEADNLIKRNLICCCIQ